MMMTPASPILLLLVASLISSRGDAAEVLLETHLDFDGEDSKSSRPSHTPPFLPIIVDTEEHVDKTDAGKGTLMNQSKKRFRKLIIGGTEADISRFPYFARVDADHNNCGGALIHENIVITVAQCGDYLGIGSGGTPADEFSVVVGEAYQDWSDQTSPSAVERGVIRKIFHPLHDELLYRFNFMLLVLDAPITTLTPLRLMNFDPNLPMDGDLLTFLGFGNTYYPENPDYLDSPEILLRGTFPAISHTRCTGGEFLRDLDETVYEEDMLCAAGGSTSVCGSDWGGPLFKMGSSAAEDVLYGVAFILGNNFCDPRYVSVFSRISRVHEWIEDAICAYGSNPPASCIGAPTQAPSPTPAPTPCEDYEGEIWAGYFFDNVTCDWINAKKLRTWWFCNYALFSGKNRDYCPKTCGRC